MEDKIVRKLYIPQLDPVASTAFNVTMAMGGCKTILESFYSVVESKRQVIQDHVTLEDRTLVDWTMSNVLKSTSVVSHAALF